MSFWYRNGVCSNNRHSHRPSNIRVRHAAGALSILCGVGVVAHAQDAQLSGLTARLDISQRLEYSDNPDLEAEADSDFFGRTVLDFGLESVTALETFTFNIGTDIEEMRDDQSTLDLTNPIMRLRYDRATDAANIGFSLRYQESDVSSSFFGDDFPIDGNVIEQDTGTRQSYGYALNGAFGLNAPLGAAYDFRRDEIRYLDSDDPGLVDQTRDNFSGEVNFRIDPRITARLTGKYINQDYHGDGVDRRTTGYGLGALLDVTPRLVADLSISQDEIELTGDDNRTEEGLTFGAELTRQVPNGTIGLSAASEVTSNGRREFLSLTRDMELLRGSLAFTAGLTNSETAGTDPLFDVSYLHRLSTSSFTLGLSQTVTSDSDNQEDINTTFRANYDYQINSLSSLTAGATLFDRNALGEDASDGRRLDLSLSYRYALTRDWGLVNGFTHQISSSDTEDTRTSNTVFIGLERSFLWRP